MEKEASREKFSSRFTALLAIIMTSWGLGNIWRFPYLTAKYGGASFVIAYIVAVICVVIVGNQVEACLGKYTRRGVVGAFTALGKRPFWRIVGWIILWSNVVVMIYYNNVIAWVFRYFFTSFGGGVFHAPSTEAFFNSFIDTPQVIFWTLLVNVVVFGILWFGVVDGLERLAKIMGPLLFGMIILLLVRSLFLPNALQGVEYYLSPKWQYLGSWETWTQAIGQALWSGCFGQGIMLAMGSYMKKEDDVSKAFFTSGLLDAATSWLAGFAIIPATVAFAIPLASGTSLSFLTLPNIFKEMAGGQFFMIIFFGALAIAGLCASVGCIESITAPLMDEWRASRKLIIPLLFIAFNIGAIPTSLSKNVMDWMDTTLGTFAYPLCGLLILMFAGWAYGAAKLRREVLNADADIKIGGWWDIMVKYIAPAFLIFGAFGFAKLWLFAYVPTSISIAVIIPFVLVLLVAVGVIIKGGIPTNGKGPANTSSYNS